MAGISSLGAGSGLDLDSLVQRLVAAERQPTETRLDRNEARFQSQLSAIGTVKGALSALRDASQSLGGGSGLDARTVTSSDPEVFTASAAPGLAPSSFGIEVVSLASANKVASDPVATADTQVGSGTLTLSVGDNSFSIDVDEGAGSLADIRDAINRAPGNTSVSAAVLNEDGGSRLILTARNTGAANSIAIAATGGDGGLSALTTTTELQAASDAVVNVDTFTFSSPSNRVDGIIEGLTLDLVKADPGNVQTVTIAEDRSAAVDKVRGLVERLNALTSATGRVASYDADTGEAGPLLGDATLRGINSRVQQILGAQVGAAGPAFNSLPALGITTNEAGLLELNESALNRALDESPNVLTTVLGGENGIATRLGSYLGDVLGSNSLIANREQGLRTSLDAIGDQREALDRRIESVEARFISQFSALDGLVAQLSQTGDFLQQQLSNLPGVIGSRNRN
ncbi:MAG: flagellar filament capping protein FliD [Chromatocurvus sp.]